MSQQPHSFKLLRKKVKGGRILARKGDDKRVIVWRDRRGKTHTGTRVKPRSHK